MTVVEASLTFYQDLLQPGIRIRYNEDGIIEDIGSHIPESHVTQRLDGEALFPGFVNSHSHAFHRGLRNVAEGEPDDVANFWSWRNNMYALVQNSTADEFYSISKEAFNEMLRSGITTVGEFHYWHRGGTDSTCFAYDELILKAAAESGIRIVLLLTYYEQAGMQNEPLHEAQKRFVIKSQQSYWNNFDKLNQKLSVNQTLGAAVHSIRAVSSDNIKSLCVEARKRNIPCHMHLEEQPKEIETSRSHYGKTPVRHLLDEDLVSDTFTGVHCTHTSDGNLEELLSRGGHVCVCPLTEGRLGDGVFQWPKMKDPSICLGSDCNERICFAEEMRWLLYTQQMRHVRRGLDSMAPGDCARLLMQVATVNGADSLGLKGRVGRLEKGYFADFFTIDLNHPNLSSCTSPAAVLDAFVFGCSSDAVITTVTVGGLSKMIRPPTAVLPVKETKLIKPRMTARDLNPSDVVELTHGLMSIESISGNERHLGEILTGFFKQQGWHVFQQEVGDRFNLLCTYGQAFTPGDPGPRFLFNSHLDVVPPYIPPSRSANGKRLLGRGACDPKGVYAAMIIAALRAPEAVRKQLGFLLLVSEETDHSGAKASNALGLRPEVVVCGEPTEGKLGRGQKGILKLKLRSKGKAGHSGYPEVGRSAIDPLLDVLQDLRSSQLPEDPVLGNTTLNIGMINGGVAMNVIPPDAEAALMYRVVTDPSLVMKSVEDAVSKVHGITIEPSTQNKPYKLDTLDGFETQVLSFNTDLPYMNLPESCKRFIYGPGSIKVAHSADEYIEIDDLKTAVKTYESMIEKLL